MDENMVKIAYANFFKQLNASGIEFHVSKTSLLAFLLTEPDDSSYTMTENMIEAAEFRYYKPSQTAQELIQRIGNKRFNEITILLEHTEKSGSIPKSNPHLLHAEIKNTIARHDDSSLRLHELS
ncbi:hypothetical protein TNCV_4537761 [Trichonephila clavipes]|nr:hypothetical protein TNCV_4537761 [Trichonephila clavipes]